MDLVRNDELLVQEEVGGSIGQKAEIQGILREQMRDIKEEQHVQEKFVIPSQYDLLYQDAMSRLLRHQRIQKAFMEKDCTFTPQINKSRKYQMNISNTTASLNNVQKAATSRAASKRLYNQATKQI